MSEEKDSKVTPQSLIKEEHVKAALKDDKGKDAELVSWKVVDFTKKGDNYACIVTSVNTSYLQGGREGSVTYVVKCNPCRQMAALKEFIHVLFIKEAGFYQQLLPQLNAELELAGQEPLRLTQCYKVNLVKDEEIIILKDLRPDGFKMFDRMKGMDTAHTSLVLKELARIHAAGVMLQSKTSESLDEKYKYLQRDLLNFTDDSQDQFGNVFKSYYENGADMAEKIGGYDNVVTWLRNFVPHINDAFTDQVMKVPPFVTVCHGDCWNNNVLFKYDGTGTPVDVRLLDLQMCRQASPATDLNYLFYTSLNGDVRKNNLEAFLHTYFETFCSILRKSDTKLPYTQKEFREEYHNKNMFGLMMGLMIVPIVVSEALDLNECNEDKNMEAMMTNFRAKVLEQLDTNPVLQPRLLSMFDDMVEYGVIS